ncbi:MAG: glycolate oxidase subunit GlcE [Betaproteobacteria bacterium]|nr:glycolate oxidase subunit GlcE [Betaproteobacteria bacterium]
MSDPVNQYAEAIRTAADAKEPLRIRGGGSKDFYGNAGAGSLLDVSGYAGVIDYEPTELVITARCGTPLADIEAVMRDKGQMLGFEPPHFGNNTTLGGCIAAGLSGPRRPYAGSVRDFVLGLRILDGRGNDLKFGGQVMKNVAGYDVSRLITGSMGTLGVILEVSLKALPLPPAELTICRNQTKEEALVLMNEWAGKPLPITGTCHVEKRLYVRLAGAASAVKAAAAKLGGEEIENAAEFWRDIRDQRDVFFSGDMPLWRLSLKSTTPHLADLPGMQLHEWGGALRWLTSDADAKTIRKAARSGDGHATLFRRGNGTAGEATTGAFHPLPDVMMQLHRNVKQAMDPAGILNPGRMYPEL